MDDKNDIKETSCECPKGEFKCSHAAALFIHGIHNLSRTDIECTWRKKKTINDNQLSAAEMFPLAKPYNPLTREPTQDDRDFLFARLQQYGKFTGIWWIMTPEPASVNPMPILTIEELIYNENFLEVQGIQNQIAYIQEKAKLTTNVIHVVAELTKGQRDNPMWHQARRGRLTASNFGRVLKCKRPTPALIKRLIGENDLSGVKAVQWGVNNEKEGMKFFVNMTGLPIKETGLWLDESGVIGASPDGLVGNNHVVEIKCPYTQRNELIADAVKNDTFCLKLNVNGTYSLKEDHIYWHQVQGQLYLTKRNFCYFVVWTSKDAVSICIKRDESWEPNIDALKEFYFLHIFPKITEGEL